MFGQVGFSDFRFRALDFLGSRVFLFRIWGSMCFKFTIRGNVWGLSVGRVHSLGISGSRV